MSRKSFLKPFVSSVATLLAATQVSASLPTALPNRVIEDIKSATPSADLGTTLETSQAGVEFAAHGSHSSHSSHSSHASHSSHSSSSF